MRTAVVLAACVSVCCLVGRAAIPAGFPAPLPSIERVFPQSATVGQAVEVRLDGNFLDQARSLQFETEGLHGEVFESTFTRAGIRLRSSADSKPGLYSIRLLTSRGISNVFHFRLTAWPSVSEQEPNDRPEQASAVSDGTSVNGVITSVNDTDFYRFRAAAGETIAFNLLSGRNGYATVGEAGHFTLTLLDSSGRVLVTKLSGFLMDPYFKYRFEAKGEYLLAVNQSRMAVTCLENDCEQRWISASYQLAIGRSPVLWSVWPPAGQRGTSVEALLVADFVESSTSIQISGDGVSARVLGGDGGVSSPFRVRLDIARDAAPGVRHLRVPDASGLLFPLAFVVTDTNFITETEPNDSLQDSALIEPPALLLGRVNRSGDVDSFRFNATGADLLGFRLRARNLGSAMVDPNLAVLCREGDLITFNDDDPSFRNPRNRDPYLEFKLADASHCANRDEGFFVQIRDSSVHSGDTSFYLFEVSKSSPAFSLGLQSERIALQRGRSMKIPISLRRLEDFDGDVAVSVEELPAGVTVEPLLLGPGESGAQLEFSVGDDAREGTWNAKVSGTAKLPGGDLSIPVTLPQARLGDGLGYVDAGQQPLFVSVVAPVEFTLERLGPPGAGFALDRHSLSLNGDRRTKVLIKIKRSPEAPQPMEFLVEGLPEGVIAEKWELREEGQLAESVLQALEGAEPALGEHRITVVAKAGAEGTSARQATTAFFLRIER